MKSTETPVGFVQTYFNTLRSRAEAQAKEKYYSNLSHTFTKLLAEAAKDQNEIIDWATEKFQKFLAENEYCILSNKWEPKEK